MACQLSGRWPPLRLSRTRQGRLGRSARHRSGALSQLVQGLSFANIIIVPDLFGIQSLWITSRDLGGVLGLEVKKNLLVPGNRMLKRLLDYAIAAPASSHPCPCWRWRPYGLRS